MVSLSAKKLSGSAHELGSGRQHEPEALRDLGQRLREVAGERPPELVLVVVKHPVGAELPGEAGQPRAALP
jgi:hypothetical protein